jgi:hypothetical protein
MSFTESEVEILCCSCRSLVTYSCIREVTFSDHLELRSRSLSSTFRRFHISKSFSDTYHPKTKTKPHGLSPRANYTNRATVSCLRSDYQLFADRECHVVNVTDPYARILGFLDRSRYFSIK